MFLKSVSQIQEKEAHALWSITFTEHQAAVTRVCGLLFLVQVILVSYWSILLILVSYWSILIILVSHWSILLILVLVQISCWTPYSVLCLWTTILPPETLNVYFTLIPSIACKVRKIKFFCSKSL